MRLLAKRRPKPSSINDPFPPCSSLEKLTMTSIPVLDRDGFHLNRWTGDGTKLEVASNLAGVDATRACMRRDLEDSKASESSLFCEHLSETFNVLRGTYLLDRNWKLDALDFSRLIEMMGMAHQACLVSGMQLPSIRVDQPS